MWMNREPVAIELCASITEAAALMSVKQVRRLPVVESCPDGRILRGIVSKSDLFRAYPANIDPFSQLAKDEYKGKETVGLIMSPHPVTTTPDTPIEQAAGIMRERKIGALPVLKKGALIGLITESDIFRAFVEILHSERGEARITFDISKHEDTLLHVVKLANVRNVRVVSVLTYDHDERPLCVIRALGGMMDLFLQDLWRSGHPVVNVLR
jgi:acetoin utilization protein AcuB